MRLIDEYRGYGLDVSSVLLTRYNGERNARNFMSNLQQRGIRVYAHEPIDGYPTDLDELFGEEGFIKNEYIETSKKIIVVTGPGAGSGKLGACLSQLYHENRRGIKASYAKFETFPVWNLPLKHPVNVAYEAATVDLMDTTMIDNYHYEAYDEVAVNYNRDIKMFPAIRRIIENISSDELPYKSPTDMGVNCIKDGIIDDEIVQEASNQEIIRRYFETENDYKMGSVDEDIRSRMQLLMEESNLKPEDRIPVEAAREYNEELQERYDDDAIQAAMAIELQDGTIVSGRTSALMDATGAMILNSLKHLADIADQIDLLAPMILGTIQTLKKNELQSKVPKLTCNELLIALAISAVTNPTAKLAYDKLPELKGCQAHSTVILTRDNKETLQRLGVEVTNDPVYPSDNLYYN
jgi:uncharacterized protein (UPF0371 family)